MNILVIDTATEGCSAAISRDTGTDRENLFDVFELCPQQHSQRLLPMVDGLLSAAKMTLKDIDLLAFGRGPGSFTGVRIATGMVQGLAFGADLPVVGVSTLAAMAQQAIMQHDQHYIATAIDARMGEVYWGLYSAQQGQAELIGQERVLPPEEAAATLSDTPHRWYTVGTGWDAYPQLNSISRVQTTTSIVYPAARYMVPLAHAAMLRDEAVTADKVEPIYLRDKVTWKKLPGRE